MGKAFIWMTFLFGLLGSLKAQSDSTIFIIDPIQDFGMKPMQKKSIDLLYTIVNNPKSSVTLSAEPACSCLQVKLDSGSLADGDSSIAIVSFDSWHHPGKVYYEIPILIHAENEITESIIIGINGEVLIEQKEIKRIFPEGNGSLLVSRDYLSFGNVNETRSISLKVYNAADSVIQLALNKPLSDQFIVLLPDSIAPNSTREIRITRLYEGSDYGVFNDRFDLKVKGDSVAIPIRVSGMIIPNFREGELNPEISLSEDLIDMGSIANDELVTDSLPITNSGQVPLNILKIETNCSCVQAKVEEDQIEPGEETLLKIIFDPTGRRDRQYKSIYLYTNDPLTPVKIVYLKANIR